MARLDWTTFIIIFHYCYLSLSFVTIITTLPFAEAGLDDSKKRIFKVLKRKSFLFILDFYSFNLGVCVVHLEIFHYFIVPTLKYLALNPGNLVWKPPVCLLWEALQYILFKILDNCDMFVSFYISMVEIQAPETCLIFWMYRSRS